MKNLKRNLIFIASTNAVLLIACIAFTLHQFSLHPQLSFGMILLLIIDFIVLSSFISLLTITVQYFIRKIKKNKDNSKK